jgi:hypothetical protein
VEDWELRQDCRLPALIFAWDSATFGILVGSGKPNDEANEDKIAKEKE